MNKKIIYSLIIIVLLIGCIISFIFFNHKKEETKVQNLSELVLYKLKFSEIEEYNNLKLVYDEKNNICNLYDLSISNTNPIETLRRDDNTYLFDYIHLGKYSEKNTFKTNDNYPKIISLINDFYILYNKNNDKYTRSIKIKGRDAIKYKESEEYIIFSDENKKSYFLLPINNINYSSSYVINNDNAITYFYRENKNYIYPELYIYNYKTGEIVKHYSFEKLKNNYGYEDSPFGYNYDNHLFMIYDLNYYLNVDNLKEMTLKNASFEYDGLIINDNKLYDYKLNLIKEFDISEKPIYIPIVINETESSIVLYQKDNVIFDLNNNIIYQLKTDEKYYVESERILVYNNEYISKVLDYKGNIVFDNTDNKYNINTPKNKEELWDIAVSFDDNGNYSTYNNNYFLLKSFKNNKEIHFNYILQNDMYLNIEDNRKITIYDKDLNIHFSFKYEGSEEIYNTDYSYLDNDIVVFNLLVGSEEETLYSIIYLYDIKNNKLIIDTPIYSKQAYSFIKTNDNKLIILGSDNINDINSKVYIIAENNYILNNDLNASYFYNNYDDHLMLETQDDNYIIISTSKLK